MPATHFCTGPGIGKRPCFWEQRHDNLFIEGKIRIQSFYGLSETKTGYNTGLPELIRDVRHRAGMPPKQFRVCRYWPGLLGPSKIAFRHAPNIRNTVNCRAVSRCTLILGLLTMSRN